jgi:hypothetical protein
MRINRLIDSSPAKQPCCAPQHHNNQNADREVVVPSDLHSTEERTPKEAPSGFAELLTQAKRQGFGGWGAALAWRS